MDRGGREVGWGCLLCIVEVFERVHLEIEQLKENETETRRNKRKKKQRYRLMLETKNAICISLTYRVLWHQKYRTVSSRTQFIE